MANVNEALVENTGAELAPEGAGEAGNSVYYKAEINLETRTKKTKIRRWLLALVSYVLTELLWVESFAKSDSSFWTQEAPLFYLMIYWGINYLILRLFFYFKIDFPRRARQNLRETQREFLQSKAAPYGLQVSSVEFTEGSSFYRTFLGVNAGRRTFVFGGQVEFWEAPFANVERYYLKDGHLVLELAGEGHNCAGLRLPPVEDGDWESLQNAERCFGMFRLLRQYAPEASRLPTDENDPFVQALENGRDETGSMEFYHPEIRERLKKDRNFRKRVLGWGIAFLGFFTAACVLTGSAIVSYRDTMEAYYEEQRTKTARRSIDHQNTNSEKHTTSSSHSSTGSKKNSDPDPSYYSDAEDFYYDYYDDFWDYEDAEEYFDEYWD